ncbi:protein-export chaperone SecB [Anaerocolumna aminovalerica]|uniref:protein-export chaperone SecB n=1 Tax=Anaerocolumna aminovalerica TaxID=1527 RepID=UPI001C0E9008|nr:protein-export chaperone SecB [Anaerocolumna aminovalerica]MBU5332723.1 protein-export chaperone SecB [Anaerocolumna aminovalerica]
MDIKTKYASPLILKDILISESKFSRVESSIENVELGINVERELEKLSEEEYRIVLEVMVTDGNEKVNIYVKCVANFNTEQENMDLIERNTIAIMFPYVRSYISTLTTQPGMAPVVLPAMNIVAMLNDKK